MYGYVIHELCDICNNKHIWQPFLQKHPEEWGKGYGNLNHQEIAQMDTWMYQTHEHKDEIWTALENAESIDFEGLVSEAEMERQRQNILRIWYSALPEPEISGNMLHTPESEHEFIDLATAFVAEKLEL